MVSEKESDNLSCILWFSCALYTSKHVHYVFLFTCRPTACLMALVVQPSFASDTPSSSFVAAGKKIDACCFSVWYIRRVGSTFY